jgi:YebC/PmpR family DNA-binding regulatory protein
MSGHNKWSQIKHQKEKTDAKKSQVFSKFAKLIADEARKAKGNRESTGLKTAIDRARAENMPSDNIERAIKKASGSDARIMESALYEAYGPGGCAMLIEVLTDNKNRASQEVKHILSEYGFSLAGVGAAAWAFQKKHDGWVAQTTIQLAEADVAALEKLVDSLEVSDDVQNVYTNAE